MKKECENIFGNKSKFAIEVKLWQLNESPIFINYCLWISNNMVGNIEQSAVLSAELDRIFNVTEQKGQRHISSDSLLANAFTDKLIENIWLNECDFTQNPTFANLDILSQHGECFEGYFVFLVEQQSHEWLLTKDNIDNRYYNIKLPAGMIYSYFEEFSKWIRDSTILALRTDKASITNR